MLALLLVLAADGGGGYALDLDYEFTSPEASKSNVYGWLVQTQTGVLPSATVAPGATFITGWDGGLVLDENGLRCIHGPTDITYRLSWPAVDFPMPDAGGGGRIETCYRPAFDTSRECSGATTPYWLGTNYLVDLWDGSTHTYVAVVGHGTCDQLFARTANGGNETTFTWDGLGDRLGRTQCLSVEWRFSDASHCKVWHRRSVYEGRPPLGWAAREVIGADESGNGHCPGVTAYAFLCERWSAEAQTSTTIHSFKMGRGL